jgi:hypothetical protein
LGYPEALTNIYENFHDILVEGDFLAITRIPKRVHPRGSGQHAIGIIY